MPSFLPNDLVRAPWWTVIRCTEGHLSVGGKFNAPNKVRADPVWVRRTLRVVGVAVLVVFARSRLRGLGEVEVAREGVVPTGPPWWPHVSHATVLLVPSWYQR